MVIFKDVLFYYCSDISTKLVFALQFKSIFSESFMPIEEFLMSPYIPDERWENIKEIVISVRDAENVDYF